VVVEWEDWRERARRRLPRAVFDYLEGGAGGESGLRRNRLAFERLLLRPRRLNDVSRVKTVAELLGTSYPLPLIVGPTGLNGVFWPHGDIEMAGAAAAAGLPFVLSTAGTSTIEQVARASSGELWFQLYVVQQDLARSLVRRALDAGCRTLVVTVDVPVNGDRRRDLRSGFRIPFRPSPALVLDAALHPGWTFAQLRHGMPRLASLASADASGISAQAALMNRKMDASFGWDDLRRLRDLWPGNLIVKGLDCASDVRKCEECSADAVVLSNHGGRQLEHLAAPVDILPAVRASTSLPIILDSGIRTGTDVVKALALGADFVILGRVLLYGLAAAGAAGATHSLDLIRRDMETTLALLGCPDVAGLEAAHVCRETEWPARARGLLS
jgi:(S)-mandelate dehydrogenase